MLQILRTDDNHYIKELRFVRKSRDCELSWQHDDQADHFLIIATNAVGQIKTSDILSEMTESILNGAEHNGFYEHHNSEIYFVSRETFSHRNRTYIVPIRKPYPLAINVFPCVKGADGVLSVYAPEDSNIGNIYIQEILNVVIKENRFDRNFFLKKTMRLAVSIDNVEGYADNFLLYSLDNGRIKYPIPSALLGKTCQIVIPKGKTINFTVLEQYSKYYRLNVSYIMR